MISFLQNARDRFLGRGDAAVTVPPMDGALRPDGRLEEATIVAQADRPDNLVHCGNRLLFSDGGRLLHLEPVSGEVRQLHDFGSPISAMADNGGGLLAIGLADGGLFIGRPDECDTMQPVVHPELRCPVAMAFDPKGDLIVCQGSSHNGPDAWQRDLMERRASGALWRISGADRTVQRIASGLAFPFGVQPLDKGLVVSESWRHRLVLIDPAGRHTVLLDDLPGYPARLIPAEKGYWLCIFAPRNQLIEFVLREKRFRDRMMHDVDPRHWIAPTLTSVRSYLDPMQGGGMITHGQLKPWAPTRSYGLVVRLNEAMQPISSHHSRADGRFHGVTACVAVGDDLFIASKGGGAVLKLATDAAREGM